MTPKFYTAGGITAEFGIEAETSLGFLIESYSYDVTTEKAEIYDESGDLVHTHRYNKKASINLSGIGTSAPTVGSVITSLVNTAGGQLAGTILVDQVVITKSSSDFQRIEVSATQYDETLTLVAS